MKRRIFNTLFVSILIVTFVTCYNPIAYSDGIEVGDIVSNFTLFDFEGNDHTLYDYEGHVIFINFWAVI